MLIIEGLWREGCSLLGGLEGRVLVIGGRGRGRRCSLLAGGSRGERGHPCLGRLGCPVQRGCSVLGGAGDVLWGAGYLLLGGWQSGAGMFAAGVFEGGGAGGVCGRGSFVGGAFVPGGFDRQKGKSGCYLLGKVFRVGGVAVQWSWLSAWWVSLDGDMMRGAIKPPGLALLCAGLFTSAPGEQNLDRACPSTSPWQGGTQTCYCTKSILSAGRRWLVLGLLFSSPFLRVLLPSVFEGRV